MGTVVDISATGAKLRVKGDVEIGSMVRLHPVGEAGELLFDVRAKVVRIAAELPGGHTDVGLEFVTVDKKRLAALRRIFDEMPATDDAKIEVVEPESPEPSGPREAPHHRIRARLPAASRREPKWARSRQL